MDRNKEKYLVLVLIICVVLSFGGGYLLGNNIKKCDKMTIVNKENNEVTANEFFEIENILSEYNNNELLSLLYNYYVVDNKASNNDNALYNYVNSLDTMDKLSISSTVGKVSKIENGLESLFGKRIEIKREDCGYYNDSGLPFIVYNKETDEFELNEDNDLIYSDIPTWLNAIQYYNYKLDSINKENDTYVITYYGLYEERMDLGPSTYFNKDKSINRFYYDEDGVSFETYINKEFINNKDKFLKLEYSFKKNDNGFYLVGFREV